MTAVKTGTSISITKSFADNAPAGTQLTVSAFNDWAKRDDGSWAEIKTGGLGPDATEVLEDYQFVSRFDGCEMSIVSFPDPSGAATAALEDAIAINDAKSRIWGATLGEADDLSVLRAKRDAIHARLLRMKEVAFAERDAATTKEADRQISDFTWQCLDHLTKEADEVNARINSLTSEGA